MLPALLNLSSQLGRYRESYKIHFLFTIASMLFCAKMHNGVNPPHICGNPHPKSMNIGEAGLNSIDFDFVMALSVTGAAKIG